MSILSSWFTRPPRIMLRGELGREADGRWIADVTDLPGVIAYGATANEARAHATALALRVIADRLEFGEQPIEPVLRLELELSLQPA